MRLIDPYRVASSLQALTQEQNERSIIVMTVREKNTLRAQTRLARGIEARFTFIALPLPSLLLVLGL
jgi:hypothetical protein